ncbi:hypothetical protein Hanom_Chr03g00215681 [Helianthus anomalus]
MKLKYKGYAFLRTLVQLDKQDQNLPIPGRNHNWSKLCGGTLIVAALNHNHHKTTTGETLNQPMSLSLFLFRPPSPYSL